MAKCRAHISEIPSPVNDLACHLLFPATNEPVAEMQTQHRAIPHAPNIVFSTRDIFFHHGSSYVLFIKGSLIEVCAADTSVRGELWQGVALRI